MPFDFYDAIIGVLRRAVEPARLAEGDRLAAVGRLDEQSRAPESGAIGPDLHFFGLRASSICPGSAIEPRRARASGLREARSYVMLSDVSRRSMMEWIRVRGAGGYTLTSALQPRAFGRSW